MACIHNAPTRTKEELKRLLTLRFQTFQASPSLANSTQLP